jgi:hypothetical protein
MTSFHTYDPAIGGAPLPDLPPLPIGALVVGAKNLLQEAADLPDPRSVAIYDTEHISVQFEPDPSGLRAVTRWALRFGGVVVSEPYQGDDGPQTWCRTEFGYYGVSVQAYALIPAGTAST